MTAVNPRNFPVVLPIPAEQRGHPGIPGSCQRVSYADEDALDGARGVLVEADG